MNGISSVTDSPRSGQAHPVVTPQAIGAAEDIVKDNRHVTVNEIAAHLDISHGSAQHIVHDDLQFHKVFNKVRDQTKLRVSFDPPSYNKIISSTSLVLILQLSQ